MSDIERRIGPRRPKDIEPAWFDKGMAVFAGACIALVLFMCYTTPEEALKALSTLFSLISW